MTTETIMRVHPAPERPAMTEDTRPVSPELGAELMRLEREQRVALDRKRQAELARLRAVQSFD